MTNEPPRPSCPECGNPLPPDAPQALCPACLLQTALSSGDRIQYFGAYELLEELGLGGMGLVWKARQLSLQRTVALKMLRGSSAADAQAVERFRREAEAAAHLQHPNIVAIHEVGEHEGQHFFTMDYVAGRSLAEELGGKPMAPRRATELLATLAQAVQYAHQRGILHRDLKPQNVMLDAAGEPHLMDFGLARRLEVDSSLTQTGQVLGSPSYMAPEQAQGLGQQVGPASDVYALGAILYEALTGQPPFRGGTVLETLRLVLEQPPITPSRLRLGIPHDLETICLKCLEKRPEHRYPTARALAEELQRVLAGVPIQARRASPWRRAGAAVRRRPGLIAGASAAAVTLLLGCIYYLWQENAFLQARIANPALARQPGKLAASLREWTGFGGLLVMNLGLWTGAWFDQRARRSKFWQFWDGKQTPQMPEPVPPGVSRFAAAVGGICVATGLYLLLRIIEVQVWEGLAVPPRHPGSSLASHYFVAFAILWIGLLLWLRVWEDAQRKWQGTSSGDFSLAERDAIDRAVAELDYAGAEQRYRQALPAAPAHEVRDYVRQRAAAFRQERAEAARVPRPTWRDIRAARLLGATLCLWTALIVGLWLSGTPAPGVIVYYLACGYAAGVASLLGALLSRPWQHALAVTVPSMGPGVASMLLFTRPPASSMWLFLVGGLAGFAVAKLGRPRLSAAR